MRGRKRHRKKRNKPIVALLNRWLELQRPEIERAAREMLEQQILYGRGRVVYEVRDPALQFAGRPS